MSDLGDPGKHGVPGTKKLDGRLTYARMSVDREQYFVVVNNMKCI